MDTFEYRLILTCISDEYEDELFSCRETKNNLAPRIKDEADPFFRYGMEAEYKYLVGHCSLLEELLKELSAAPIENTGEENGNR